MEEHLEQNEQNKHAKLIFKLDRSDGTRQFKQKEKAVLRFQQLL
jgi:hypothetical protein